MVEKIAYLIDAPDGRRFRAYFSDSKLPVDGNTAPSDLLLHLGLNPESKSWRLRALRRGNQSELRFCLVRTCIAAARNSPFDPRQARLKKERLALEKLNTESDHVRVEPLEWAAGSEPEKYKIIFLCRGISGIDGSRKPTYSDRHEVLIHCDDFFPSDVPKLRWETPIWHPNIKHDEPKSVCVNKAEWLGGMGLEDLVRLMFEMVQYKNYHADEETPPFPLDRDVAKWVREYAEPAGIVNKKHGISVDDQPFTRPTVTGPSSAVVTSRIKLVKPKEPRIKLLSPDQGSQATSESPLGRIKIKKQE